MKTFFKIFVLLSVVAYLIFAVVKFSRPEDEELCTQIDIMIVMPDSSAVSNFLSKNYILDIIYGGGFRPEGKPLKEVNLTGIRTLLEKNPYIDDASCYYTPAGILCVTVTSKQPIMEVMPEGGAPYYMDSKGAVIPLGQYNLKLPLVTGQLNRSQAASLIPLATFIARDSHWRELIEQVSYHDGSISLTLRDGDFNVIMGSIDDYQQKLENLNIFLTQGLPKVGWNKYSTINIAYNNQIVCQK